MMGVVTGVEVVVMQSAMEPVVEELHRAGMEEDGKDDSFGVPPWLIRCSWYDHIAQVQQECSQDNLIVPANSFVFN